MRWRTRIAVAAATGLASAMMASAGSAQVGSLGCSRGSGSFSCVGGLGSARGVFPQVIHLTAPVDDEDIRRSNARHARWMARCQPEFRIDRYGVSRAVYAAPDCDFGRIED